MPSVPKPTLPIYNEDGVEAPPLTRPLSVPMLGQQDGMIASGSNNKLSWANIFSIRCTGASDALQSLDNSVASMARDSRFLEALIKNIPTKNVEGRRNDRIITLKQVLPMIAEHRAAWDWEILARGLAAVQNWVTMMIPRHKDRLAAVYQLTWHEYYDDFPDMMLWAILREFLKFLKSLITRSDALKSKASLATALLDVCHVQIAANADAGRERGVRCFIDLTEDVSGDEGDADEGEAGGLEDVAAEVVRQDVDLDVPAAVVAKSSDRGQHVHSGSQSAAANLEVPTPVFADRSDHDQNVHSVSQSVAADTEVPAVEAASASNHDQHDHNGPQSAAADSNTPALVSDTQEGAQPTSPSASQDQSTLTKCETFTMFFMAMVVYLLGRMIWVALTQ